MGFFVGGCIGTDNEYPLDYAEKVIFRNKEQAKPEFSKTTYLRIPSHF